MIASVKATEGLGSGVLKKTIHKGSESIMFSVLQETQYMYPVKSSVREIVSNSLDSINERNNALKILDGRIKESDLFINKEGTEFSDSKFDDSYYDEKWLSKDDIVTIKYIENDSDTRDRIKFIDRGVGLGGSRLIKYFSLGFSTKRLSKNQLGSFGLGAKSLLATGVDFYTVSSCYNGREYSFNVYKDHVISNISKFNEDGTTNKLQKFYNDYETFYRTTTSKNNVVVEAEVKRHKKQDFISSIENQLGYIENIELLMSDKKYNITNNHRNIKNVVLYSTDKILVGESDYYARPQILLKPGEDSDILISYGVINFDELEMKKYNGNVSFIMNINEVDVTPSREHVIWNTKTRNAIKKMFLEAQDVVANIIKEKLSGVKNLPEHERMLDTFRNKYSIDGISELYKVIDVSELNVDYRGFKLSQAVLKLEGAAKNHEKFIFTNTEFTESYYNSKTKDSKYESKLSKKFISKLDINHSGFKDVTVYVGKTKYKDLGRYIRSEFSPKTIDIIYFKDELFEEIDVFIKTAGGLDKYIDLAYSTRSYDKVLFGEVKRAIKNGIRVLYDKDIDKTKMRKLEEKEEANTNSYYMSTAERAKKDGKVIGNVFSSSNYSYREYFNEATFTSQPNKYIIYSMTNDLVKKLLTEYNSYSKVNFTIVGFSEENFKLFKDVSGVETFTNALYKIKFGDLVFTKFGRYVLNSNIINKIESNYKNTEKNLNFSNTAFSYINGTFKDFKIEKKRFDNSVDFIVANMRERQLDYLLDKYSKAEKYNTLVKNE